MGAEPVAEMLWFYFRMLSNGSREIALLNSSLGPFQVIWTELPETFNFSIHVILAYKYRVFYNKL